MGVTVHFVDEGVDTGPVILQEAFELPYARDIEAVEERVHEIEHRLLPRAVRLIAAGAGPASTRTTRGRSGSMAKAAERTAPADDRARRGAVRRALLTVSDKRGLVDFARGLAELGSRDRLHRRHGARAGGGGHRDALGRGLHGLPGDPRRPRQDAQPHDLRRPAGGAVGPEHVGHARGAGDRADRPRVREPLPVRAGRGPARRRGRGGDREHRHRRARR